MTEKKNIPLEKFIENISPISFICYLNCHIASYFCYYAHRLPLTPNLITILSFASVILGIVSLCAGNPIGFAIFLPVSYTLDNADGIWARTLGPLSSKGKFLDMYTDYVKDFIVEMSLFIYFYSELFALVGNARYIAMGFSAYLIVKSLFLLMYRENIEEVRRFQTQKIRLITYTPAEKYIIVWPLAVFFFPLYLTHLLILFLAYMLFTALLFIKKMAKEQDE